jgi:hypothetical protein
MNLSIKYMKSISLIIISFFWLSCNGDDWRDPIGISQAGDGIDLKPDGTPFVPQPGHLDVSVTSINDIPFKNGGDELKIITILKNTGTEDLSVNSITLTGNIKSVEGISDGDIINGSDSLIIWIEFDGGDGTSGQVDFTWNSLDQPDSTESFSNTIKMGDDSAWDIVYDDILDKNCSCHLTSSGAGELVMNNKEVAYEQLVNNDAFEVPELKRIDPWYPDISYMVKKIVGTDIEGDRMPRDGPPFLSEKRINQIKTWVSIGAPE